MTSRTPAEILEERAKLAARMSQLDVELAATIGDSGAVVRPAKSAKLLPVDEFCKAVGISRTAFYGLLQDGFPAPLVPHVGRRVDLEQGRAWLTAQGLKNAKERRRGKRTRRSLDDVARAPVGREVPDGGR